MRGFRITLAAFAAGAALSACSSHVSGAHQPVKTDAKAFEKTLDKLRTAHFKASAKGPADFAALAAALPKPLTLTWDKLDFDKASGATVLTGARLSQTGSAEPLVHVDGLRVWDLDVDLLRARFAGQRLTETASLARHIEADGVSTHGLGELLAPFMDAYIRSITDMAKASGAQVGDLDVKTGKYNFGFGHVVLHDIVLRPWEMKPIQLSADNAWADALPGLQDAAAGLHSLAFDTWTYYDGKIDFDYSMQGAGAAVTMTIDSGGARGQRGGDIDFALVRGLKGDVSMAVPIPASATQPNDKATTPAGAASPKVKVAVEDETASNVRLDKLLGYFAKGVMPPRTDTNLLSLGVWTYDGFSESFGDRELFAMKSGQFDGAGFYWLVPTHLRMKMTGLSYNVDGFIDYMQQAMKSASPGAPFNVDPRIMEALKRHKLDEPTMDTEFGWDWNPTTGDTKIDMAFGLNDYFTFDAKADGALPDFKSVSDLIPGGFDTAKQDELAALFKKDFIVKSAEANLVDKGGLENGFALAIELSSLLPPDAQANLGIVRNATPASLRQLASSAVYVAADELTKTQPEQMKAQREMMRAVAGFIDKGGALRLRIKPDKPTAVATLSEGDRSPQQVIDLLHLTLVNDPPAGAGEKKK
jgi:hypothetical protein